MAGGLKSSLSNVSAPSAPGGIGLGDSGCFPGLSLKQRVKYFGYAFIGANVCLWMVRAAHLFVMCPYVSLRYPWLARTVPAPAFDRGSRIAVLVVAQSFAALFMLMKSLFAMLITMANLGFIVS